MGRQIIKQPNGLYAVWSTVVDDFILMDVLPEGIISIEIQEASKRIREDITEIVRKLDNGEKPYHQFTMAFEEAIKERLDAL